MSTQSFDDIEASVEDSGMDANGISDQEDSYESFDNIVPKGIEDVKEDKPLTEKNAQTKQLEDQEDGLEKKEEKEEEEEEEKDGEEESEGKEELEPKFKGKLINVDIEGETYGIPQDAKLKVKVDGKFEEVGVQELINQYSGKVAYDRKFTEIGRKAKELEAKEADVSRKLGTVKGHMDEIFKKIEESNPIDALKYLVDLKGGDALKLEKSILSNMLPELEKMLDMSEEQLEAYWAKKEAEYLRGKTEASKRQQEAERKNSEFIQTVDKLRESRNVTEDQYVESYDELIDLGYKDPNPKQVVEYAALKPFLDKSENILGGFKDQLVLDDDQLDRLTITVAEIMQENPSMTEEEVSKLVRQELGITGEVKVLNKKLSPNSKNPVVSKHKASKSDTVETWDDLFN